MQRSGGVKSAKHGHSGGRRNDEPCRFSAFYDFTSFNGFVKSPKRGCDLNCHEGHEEHEAEIMLYFFLRVLRALGGENRTFYEVIKAKKSGRALIPCQVICSR
jgi:hypothetical protein